MTGPTLVTSAWSPGGSDLTRVLSHVTDSGSWLVSRFLVMETTLGLTAFAVAALPWPVSALPG